VFRRGRGEGRSAVGCGVLRGSSGGFYRAGGGRRRGGRNNGGDDWLLRPLRLSLKGIKGGMMGAVMAQRHPRRGAGGAVETPPGSAGVVEKTKPISGAHVPAGG
jgi:hypothetical protein